MREPLIPPRPERPKRITPDRAYHTCELLKREGSLDIIIDILRDRADTLDYRIRRMNGLDLMKSNEAILNAVARQAALGEIDHLVALFENYGKGIPKPERDE